MRFETVMNLAIIVGLAGFVLASHWLSEPYNITLATRIVILAMAATGLNLALGYCGLVSFGHAAFFGAGGYAAGILTSHAFNGAPLIGGWSGSNEMIVIWAAAAAVSIVLAILIGSLSLRTGGVYFIMITLAFAQMLYYFAISFPGYGGEDGLSTYVRANFPGMNTMVPGSFFGIAYAWLVGAIILTRTLIASRFGLAMQAVRQNPERAASLGISPFQIKLVTFVISAAITGIAGALYTDLNRFVSPSVLSWQLSGELIVLVIIGGVARLCGPLAGAIVFVTLEHFLGNFTEFWQFWLGFILILVVIFAPGGLLGIAKRRVANG